MTKRTSFLTLLFVVTCFLLPANSWKPRTLAEKVAEGELIALGVATLEGLPLEETEHPVKRSCRIVVLQALWPTNELATNILVVDHWAWTKWPDSWWKYSSHTGVYFFERTTTALRRDRAESKRRDPRGLFKISDDRYGTNLWMPLSRFDDWYEPATNIPVIQRVIQSSKK